MDFVEDQVDSVEDQVDFEEDRVDFEEVRVDSVELRVDCDVSVKCDVFFYFSQSPWFRLSPVV